MVKPRILEQKKGTKLADLPFGQFGCLRQYPGMLPWMSWGQEQEMIKVD